MLFCGAFERGILFSCILARFVVRRQADDAQPNQEEYMGRYHKRSNVESTFSAVKRKFGDSVMSKTDAAMANAVLCKILCHNLTCLIQEQESLGIAPVFWHDDDETDAGPAILRMPLSR